MKSFAKPAIKLWLVVLAIASLSSCLRNQQNTAIDIEVVNDEGTPIANAKIFINDELESHTDNNGRASLEKSFSYNSDITLEVRKTSELRYYAPYSTRISINERSYDKKRVKATLYSVPKPSASDDKLGSTPNIAVNELKDLDKVKAIDAEKEPEKTSNLNQNSKETEAVDDQVEIEKNEQNEIVNSEKTTPSTVEQNKIDSPSLVSLKAIAVDEKIAKDLTGKPRRQKDNLINFYAFENNQPLEDVEIYIGYVQKGTLTLACKTNKNGRCIYKSEEQEKAPATIVAQKKGYQTQDKNYQLKDGNRIRFNMKQGHTIDIFAIMKRYDQARGVEGIEVYVNGKKVTETDEFGRSSYLYQGKPGDLVEVTLKSDNYIPKTYTTDYVIAGPTSLVRYYSPEKLEPIKVALAPIQAAGRLGGKTLENFGSETNKILSGAMRSRFFTHPVFQKADENIIKSLSKRTNKNLLELLNQGWKDTDIQTDLDAVVLPTLILQNPLRIELSLLNSAGEVLTAAQEELISFADKNAINYSVESLKKKLIQKFPFEGTIIQKDTDTVWVNIGKNQKLQLNVGDEFNILGPQSDELGQKITHTYIGKLRINQVLKEKSRAQIIKTMPRSLIDTGDQIVLKRKQALSKDQITFNIIDIDEKKPISQANIYFQNNWLGSTNDKGVLTIGKSGLNGTSLLHIIKPGYQDFTKELKLTSLNQIEIPLERETAFVQLESDPEKAKVYLDGSYVGETPFQRPVAAPTGFVKLEVVGPKGFKKLEKILDLSAGTLSLTGDRKIFLEQDFLTEANNKLKSGDFVSALKIFESIRPEHSDYLIAQHQAGEIYLISYKSPVKAATAFAKVTADPEVRGFNNKQFISSHVNEAIALFMAGSNLESESKEAAIAHYSKAIEIFSNVEPQLRYITRSQQAEAYHNTLYYKALASHRIWDLSSDPAVLSLAHKNWLHYLNGSASNQASKNSSIYTKNAETYLKQIEASINTAQNATKEGKL